MTTETTTTAAQKTASFQASGDAKILAHVLRGASIGDLVSYSKLTAAIARDVQTDARSVLETARQIVQREDKMIFDAVRGMGLKRLTDEEIVGLGDRTRDHVRRSARRVVKKMVCVDYNNLSAEKQVQHNTALSMFGLFAEIATDKSTLRLSEAVKDARSDLPIIKASMAALGLTM